MREALPITRRKLTALVIIVVAVTAGLGTYIHDNPSGITPIADINAGRVASWDNVTIKGRIMSVLAMLPNLQLLTVGDSQANITLGWTDFLVEAGWVIIARGTVASRSELGHIWLSASSSSCER